MIKNQKIKPTILVILGPTASGKSDLAVQIAKKYNGEVISADSRQVYKMLDIGTGKITKEEMQGVPHYLLDVCHPKKVFTVSLYQELAEKKIREILDRGHLPIIVGGTGFYIDAIVHGKVLPEVPPNKKLRKELAKKTNIALFDILLKLDKRRALDIKNKNEINNQVRLIRAIEIAQAIGKVPKIKKKKNPYQFIQIGISVGEKKLHEKVKHRVAQMFDQGLLNEIEMLKKKGVSRKRLQEFGFEYDNPTYESVVAETKKYIKRQMTWFKRDDAIIWLPPHQVLSFVKKNLPSAIGKQKSPQK